MTLTELITKIQQAYPGWNIVVTLHVPAIGKNSYRVLGTSPGGHASLSLFGDTPQEMHRQLVWAAKEVK